MAGSDKWLQGLIAKSAGRNWGWGKGMIRVWGGVAREGAEHGQGRRGGGGGGPAWRQ